MPSVLGRLCFRGVWCINHLQSGNLIEIHTANKGVQAIGDKSPQPDP